MAAPQQLTVTAPPPTETLAANPTSLAFDGPNGGVTSLPLQLSLSPAVTTDYPFAVTLSTDTGQWLTVDPASGTIGSAGATVNIGVNFSGVSSGSHTGQVTVTVTIDSYYNSRAIVLPDKTNNALRGQPLAQR